MASTGDCAFWVVGSGPHTEKPQKQFKMLYFICGNRAGWGHWHFQTQFDGHFGLCVSQRIWVCKGLLCPAPQNALASPLSSACCVKSLIGGNIIWRGRVLGQRDLTPKKWLCHPPKTLWNSLGLSYKFGTTMVCRVPLWCWIFGGQLLFVISCPCQLALLQVALIGRSCRKPGRGEHFWMEGLDIKRIPLMPKKWYHVWPIQSPKKVTPQPRVLSSCWRSQPFGRVMGFGRIRSTLTEKGFMDRARNFNP